MQWYRGSLPPDDGVLVLIHCPNASEPVWIGHHDDERGEWLTAEGVPVSVLSWAPLPEPPAAEETYEHGVPDGVYCPISLQGEFKNYMRACYGERALPARQVREVEQAFLSGIDVLNELVVERGDGYGAAWLRQALTDRLRTLGSLL